MTTSLRKRHFYDPEYGSEEEMVSHDVDNKKPTDELADRKEPL